MEKEEKRKDEKVILIIILFIFINFMILVISHLLGKVGYVDTSSEQLDLIQVTQDDIGWNLLEELNIFKNKKYDNQNIIAPRSVGTYSFLVSNVTDKNLIYDVQLREVNNYNINNKLSFPLIV